MATPGPGGYVHADSSSFRACQQVLAARALECWRARVRSRRKPKVSAFAQNARFGGRPELQRTDPPLKTKGGAPEKAKADPSPSSARRKTFRRADSLGMTTDGWQNCRRDSSASLPQRAQQRRVSGTPAEGRIGQGLFSSVALPPPQRTQKRHALGTPLSRPGLRDGGLGMTAGECTGGPAQSGKAPGPRPTSFVACAFAPGGGRPGLQRLPESRRAKIRVEKTV